MATKKFLSLERLTEYDGLIKSKISEGDASTLSSAKSYTDSKTSNLASTTVVDNKISSHNTSTSAHSDIRNLITTLTTKVNNFLDVDDTTTDQLSEVLTLIENNKGTLESLTSGKVNVSDIVDNLTTSSATKVLSAKQGVALKALIDTLQTTVNGKANSSHSHSDATTSAAGFMTAAMVTKLNGIATGANKTTVDTALSTSSTNPVRNSVVTTAINNATSSISANTSAISSHSTAISNLQTAVSEIQEVTSEDIQALFA